MGWVIYVKKQGGREGFQELWMAFRRGFGEIWGMGERTARIVEESSRMSGTDSE